MSALGRIARERDRQVAEEGYSAEHDSGHAWELALAASCYVAAAAQLLDDGTSTVGIPPHDWPWRVVDWKPTDDPVRTLEKAGALVAAAIDSLVLPPRLAA